jgi:hypothetical protein
MKTGIATFAVSFITGFVIAFTMVRGALKRLGE